ncbi:hypothetical protein SPRG_21461 [Saprolegnia parasitica CBS 223.65]|uniref:Armadillo repeat-containing domain-containing protein n=1 Tax=Saprolegnia parasitica (strain CBS 223.65) TaxID=695850 RepID=A0A067BL67_SAPPC|nr:hypothetical protein SPRG_21461 [Saprolegnia parasitica CBS 223.65]KDO19179.1 hypothetical protein SPRG_21461 [Saprolegnia parasitica CBS 223.65]|eukprot:XP_012210123.1 hypothetical protein SPRG_21461 [Saprolegnia parasitica CBS 223.65]
MEAKTIPKLVRILHQCEGSLLVEAAVVRLGNLAAFTPLQHQIAAHGGIAALTERLADMDCTRTCATAIFTALANLVVNDTNHHVIGEPSNLDIYLGWYTDDDAATKLACARLLKNLSMWEFYATELLSRDTLPSMARDLFQRQCPSLDDLLLQCWLNMQSASMSIAQLQTMLDAIEGHTPATERAKETVLRLLLHMSKRDEASSGFGQHIVACLASLDFFTLDEDAAHARYGHTELRRWFAEQTEHEKAWDT